MGVCYTLLLHDEWDWGYRDSNKIDTLKQFEKDYPGFCHQMAEWPHYAVFDVDKGNPKYNKEKLKVIANYCENAWCYGDSSTWHLQALELPKSDVQEASDAYREDIRNRRSDEEKKASEAYIRDVLLNKTEGPI